jgi:hypothetical protein
MPFIPLDLLDTNFQSRPICLRARPPQADFSMLARAITLPFKTDLTETVKKVNSLADLDIEEIKHKFKYKAMILNLFGPVVKDYRETPRAEILEKIFEIHKKMILCLLPEKNQPIPEDLLKMGISVAHSIVPKNDPRCYETISNIHIQGRNTQTTPIPKSEHLVVGSNYLTDLSCKKTGMDYLYVKPQRGIESKSFDLLRSYAEKIVYFHDYLLQIKKNIYPGHEKQINTTYSNPYTTPYCRGQNALKRLK